MIRKAEMCDVCEIEKSYNEVIQHEKAHGAYTVWQLGVYPTGETAQKAIADGAMYVAEQDGELCGSIILNQIQPKDYAQINWNCPAKANEVLVVHLLCVRPAKSGQGIGKELVRFAMEEAKRLNCRTVRLDTGAQNKPATALYEKMGFQLAGTASMAVGGLIAHKNHLFFEITV